MNLILSISRCNWIYIIWQIFRQLKFHFEYYSTHACASLIISHEMRLFMHAHARRFCIIKARYKNWWIPQSIEMPFVCIKTTAQFNTNERKRWMAFLIIASEWGKNCDFQLKIFILKQMKAHKTYELVPHSLYFVHNLKVTFFNHLFCTLANFSFTFGLAWKDFCFKIQFRSAKQKTIPRVLHFRWPSCADDEFTLEKRNESKGKRKNNILTLLFNNNFLCVFVCFMNDEKLKSAANKHSKHAHVMVIIEWISIF
jgi:hypothetical protein